MSLLGQWEAKIVVPSGGWTSTLTESSPGGTGTPIFTAANTYYWSSPGNDTLDFPAEFKARLDAESPNGRTYTVSVSSSTGKLTVSVSSGTFTLTSVSTDWLSLMGFAGDLTPTGATFTTTKQVEGLWLPDCPSNSMHHADSAGKPISASRTLLSSDGTYSSFHGSKHKRNEIWYEWVSQAKVIVDAETTTNASYETFWLDAVRGEEPWANAGRELRWYRDIDTLSTFKTYNVVNTQSPDYTRASPTYDGFWRVQLDVAEN